jgi:hypothetical protein
MLTVPIQHGQIIRTTRQQGSRIGVVVRGPYAENGLDDSCDIWFGYDSIKPGELLVEKLIIRSDWELVETPMGV